MFILYLNVKAIAIESCNYVDIIIIAIYFDFHDTVDDKTEISSAYDQTTWNSRTFKVSEITDDFSKI